MRLAAPPSPAGTATTASSSSSRSMRPAASSAAVCWLQPAAAAPAGRLARGVCAFGAQPGRNRTSTLRAAAIKRQQDASSSGSLAEPSRRTLLAGSLAAGAGLLLGGAPAGAAAAAAAPDAPPGFKALYDPILAYSFMYPVATASGEALTMTLSHPPEKYSSAAPLTADARQRIVSELFDLRRFVTASMTVGPASGVLREQAQAEWRPKDVALTVLIDRSTARLSSGQRTALNDVEEAHSEEREGGTYWVYEHTSQGSPTVASPRPETYRHALAVSTTRPGLDGRPYIYTLNLSCPQALWDELKEPFKAAVDSFRLVATTDAYVPPDQNPWLFF